MKLLSVLRVLVVDIQPVLSVSPVSTAIAPAIVQIRRSIHHVATIPIVAHVVSATISDSVAARDKNPIPPDPHRASWPTAVPATVARVMAVNEHSRFSSQTHSSAAPLRESRG